jgi:hypothetical protein
VLGVEHDCLSGFEGRRDGLDLGVQGLELALVDEVLDLCGIRRGAGAIAMLIKRNVNEACIHCALMGEVYREDINTFIDFLYRERDVQ